MAVYIQKGDRIDYKNDTAAVIKSGDVVVMGTNRIAVAIVRSRWEHWEHWP